MLNENKRANIGVIILIGFGILLLLIIGVMAAFGGMIALWSSDIIYPEINDLGTIGNINLTQASDYTITPAYNVVQAFTWISGLLYIFGILIMFGIAFAGRFSNEKWLSGFFIVMMLLIIIVSIFMSNIYQDFYNDGSEVGTYLHKMGLLSFLILYSPLILTIVGFVCGIILFSGQEEVYA